MSAFDDLLNFGDSSETAQGTDPFDPFTASQSTNQNAGNSSGDLLGLGFDSQVSAENGSSGKVNFEANTNPLYEFTNSESKMASDSTNPLYEFNNEPVQKDMKSEPSNLLYEYMQNEGTTNGHVEDGLSNGREQEVDLLGGGDLIGGDTENVDNSGDLLENSGGGDVMDETAENVEDSGDFQENSEPVIHEDYGETADESKPGEAQEGEETQERSRSSSESSVPEEEKEENAQSQPEQVSEQVEISEKESQEQTSGPLDEGPKEGERESSPADNYEDKIGGNYEAAATTEVLDEGTSEVKADVESDEPQEIEQAKEENQNDVSEEADEQTETKVGGLNTEQEESKVEEKNVDVEEQPPVDDQESNPYAELDKPENIESAVGSEPVEKFEPEAAVEEEQITQAEAEPALEVSRIQEEATSVDTVESEKSDNVEETTPLESVEKETDNINDEFVPQEKIEEVVTEELEPEKLDPEPMPEQTSTEIPAIEEQEVVDKVETNTEEKEVEPEQPPKMVEPEQPPQKEEPEKKPDTLEIGDEEEVAVPKSPQNFDETRNSIPDENALKVNGTSEISENGVSEEDAVRDPNIFRETHEKEEVHFAEMNNVRQKFESGRTNEEEQTPRRISVKEEYDQGGEFENEPVQNPDVVKETDQPKEELPEIGMAKNLVNRFKSIQEEKAQPVVSQKRPSPPRTEKVEYESQPAEHLPQYEAKVEAGVFESEPKGHENVVRSGEQAEDYKPEQGYAKNIMNKFKEIETESSQYKSHEKRELTPDRSGKVEYVSEPRGKKIVYEETKTESGVFENVPKEEEDVVRSGDKANEILPESGMAKSLLSKFKQMETEVGNRPPPSPKKEASEWSYKKQVSQEQKGYLERYEPQTEAGEFENQPVVRPEVVRSGEQAEEILPEVGTAKKTMERFKEIQKQSSSPVSSKHKEITPPREHSPGRNVAGVFESTPKERGDVIKSGEAGVEELPEQGTTRNILNRFKEIQTSGSQSSSPGRKQKEFTPPPESGVYENKPKEHLLIESRQAESGILESTPSKSQADIAREREASPESELPEQGMAKNLVSRWKQLESASGSAQSTSSTSPRFKEFTPPRDSRGPLSPKSPAGVTNGVHPSELPGQYQPQESSVIHENKPEVKEGVYREADTDWTEGMPAPNTTSSMLQRFKSMQEQAKASEVTPEPVHRKDDSPSHQPDYEEKGMFKVVQTEKCAACQKTVYAMEKLEMNGHIYHKNCFKCSHCSARLTPKTFSMNEGVIYCVNHFKQLFARKGNYDEGFGRQQYKKKWQGEKSEGATA